MQGVMGFRGGVAFLRTDWLELGQSNQDDDLSLPLIIFQSHSSKRDSSGCAVGTQEGDEERDSIGV